MMGTHVVEVLKEWRPRGVEGAQDVRAKRERGGNDQEDEDEDELEVFFHHVYELLTFPSVGTLSYVLP